MAETRKSGGLKEPPGRFGELPKRAVIFANGTYAGGEEFYRGLLGPGDYIICADGADTLLRLGIEPDIVIGDLDSVDIKGLASWRDRGIEFLTYPSRKDKTDTELAIDHALSLGIRQILLLGALGGRIDHALANVALLVYLAERGIEAAILDEGCEIRAVTSQLELEGKSGDLLSLIPVTPRVEGVTTLGLDYPLEHDTLFFGSSRGVSNVFCSERAAVNLSSGVLLVVKVDSCPGFGP